MANEKKLRLNRNLPRCVVAASALVLLVVSYVLTSSAQAPGQRTFSSPQEASRALYEAAQKDDEKAMSEILGPAGKDLISSGDPVEDMNSRMKFAVKYEQMRRFVAEPGGTVTLYVGAENWPLPIPLVSKNGLWYYDTDAGKQEILLRRIGKNELAAIQASQDLVEAQKEYAAREQARGSSPHYAERFVSDKGRHNGLYWSETADEFDSLIDPLIALAGESSGGHTTSAPMPFNGYYFRLLSGQGDNATGGEMTYIIDGKMVRGFAFVAYPAEYRSSGVMTLIVNQSGVVYEKDLGSKTTELATAMTVYDPDSSWHQADLKPTE
jgi:hypothetical protein